MYASNQKPSYATQRTMNIYAEIENWALKNGDNEGKSAHLTAIKDEKHKFSRLRLAPLDRKNNNYLHDFEALQKLCKDLVQHKEESPCIVANSEYTDSMNMLDSYIDILSSQLLANYIYRKAMEEPNELFTEMSYVTSPTNSGPLLRYLDLPIHTLDHLKKLLDQYGSHVQINERELSSLRQIYASLDLAIFVQQAKGDPYECLFNRLYQHVDLFRGWIQVAPIGKVLIYNMNLFLVAMQEGRIPYWSDCPSIVGSNPSEGFYGHYFMRIMGWIEHPERSPDSITVDNGTYRKFVEGLMYKSPV